MRGQRHASAALYPRERPGTHCTGGWVGPRAGLNRCGKSPPPTGIRYPDRSARSQSLYRLSYPATIIIIIIINVDIEASNKWLTSTDLFAETEGFLTSIQDQAILTRNYKKYILKQPDIDELCRRCGKQWETIRLITAACDQLTPTEYVKRYDGVANVIHQKLAEAAELIEDKNPYYKYTLATVLENDSFKLSWNRSVITDKTISSNRPDTDITFMNKKQRTPS
jgi:hypothetical protein